MIESESLEAGSFEAALNAPSVPRCHDPGICYQEHTTRAVIPGQLTYAQGTTRAEDDADARFVVEISCGTEWKGSPCGDGGVTKTHWQLVRRTSHRIGFRKIMRCKRSERPGVLVNTGEARE
jgi:hypothetical protein